MSEERKILVVSAHPQRIQKILTILDQYGFASRQAATCEEALELYERWPAELIVGDYQPQEREDARLVDAIRAKNKETRFILIVPREMEKDFACVTPGRIVAFLREGYSEAELLHHLQQGFGAADPHSNRRRYSRFKMAIDTHCILINPFTNHESRPLAGLIRDVSRSGLSMLVRQVIPVPAMLKLMIDLPRSNRSITMLAKSLTCTLTQMNNVYRLGAKFVGLLPPELEEAISDWKCIGTEESDTDIFMGKSFRKALEEWLTAHQGDLADRLIDADTPLPRLVEEVCKTPGDETKRK
jgi:CheY-like chemotaxis protein